MIFVILNFILFTVVVLELQQIPKFNAFEPF